MVAKILSFVKQHRQTLGTGLCGILILWSAYNVGLIMADQGKQPLQNMPLFRESAATVSQTEKEGQGNNPTHTDLRVVVSKSSSSKKYHYSWCSGATRIKLENQIWFPTAEAAQVAGYTLAGNCKP